MHIWILTGIILIATAGIVLNTGVRHYGWFRGKPKEDAKSKFTAPGIGDG